MKKPRPDDDVDIENEMHDNFDEIEVKEETSKNDFNARRRLEALKEDKKMERLLSDEIDGWYDDMSNDIDDVLYKDLY